MGGDPVRFLQATQQIPARTQVFWGLTWWCLHWVGLLLLAPTKDDIGPHCFLSLAEHMGKRAEVYLAFNRKNKASNTWLCCTKIVEMFFFVAALSVMRWRQKHGVWDVGDWAGWPGLRCACLLCVALQNYCFLVWLFCMPLAWVF